MRLTIRTIPVEQEIEVPGSWSLASARDLVLHMGYEITAVNDTVAGASRPSEDEVGETDLGRSLSQQGVGQSQESDPGIPEESPAAPATLREQILRLKKYPGSGGWNGALDMALRVIDAHQAKVDTLCKVALQGAKSYEKGPWSHNATAANLRAAVAALREE